MMCQATKSSAYPAESEVEQLRQQNATLRAAVADMRRDLETLGQVEASIYVYVCV
jgi:uncharacterized protein involved in exopolysaccharide biosynthesis